MNLSIVDIAFIVFVLAVVFLLTKEFIPDHIKKYWHYQWQVRKDHKAGRKRKWAWTFKR